VTLNYASRFSRVDIVTQAAGRKMKEAGAMIAPKKTRPNAKKKRKILRLYVLI
jgi:hypothetical protein